MVILWPREGGKGGAEGKVYRCGLLLTWIVPTGEADEGAHAVQHGHSRSAHVHVVRLVASSHWHCAVIKSTACS